MAEKLTTSPSAPSSVTLLLPADLSLNLPTQEQPVLALRSRHLLMGYALQAMLDNDKTRALDIISNLTDIEAMEMGNAIDELYPMVAGRRAVPYAEYMKKKIAGENN